MENYVHSLSNNLITCYIIYHLNSIGTINTRMIKKNEEKFNPKRENMPNDYEDGIK